MTNDEIQSKLSFDTAKKAGKIPKIKGVSDHETTLMERIAAQTERPEVSSSEYRTAQRVNEHLAWQNKQLREDKARETQYAKELQNYLK